MDDPTNPVELGGELRLDEFVEWAGREGGRQILGDEGEELFVIRSSTGLTVVNAVQRNALLEKDPAKFAEFELYRHRLDEVTIQYDVEVMWKLVRSVAKQNQANLSLGTPKPANDLSSAANLSSAIADWSTSIEQKVKRSTMERYLVAIRRYRRFRDDSEGISVPKAPPFRRQRDASSLIRVDTVKDWLSHVEDDLRLVLATWLLLDGVKVKDLTSLTFGAELTLNPKTGDVLIGTGKPSEALQELLRSNWRTGLPVITGDSDDALTPIVFRRIWESASRSDDGQDPSMGAIQMFGRRWVTDLVDGELVARYRVPY